MDCAAPRRRLGGEDVKVIGFRFEEMKASLGRKRTHSEEIPILNSWWAGSVHARNGKLTGVVTFQK